MPPEVFWAHLTEIDPEPSGEIIYLISVWKSVGILQQKLESVAGEKDIWNILRSWLPPQPNFG